MSAFYFDSAIAWAQFQLRGGWKSLLIVSGVLSLATIFLITFACQLDNTPGARQSVIAGSLGFILLGQAVILLFVGSNMVGSSIRNDLTTRQIESHRLMPLGAMQAVTGYVAAVALRMGFVCFCLFAIGLVLCQMSAHPLSSWMVGSGLLLVFALLNWSVVALLSFTSPWGFAMLLIFQVVLFMGSVTTPLLLSVPGMRLLCGPLEGGTIFGLPGGDSVDTLIFSIGLQLALAVLCVMAAARKYERDDQRGLPLWLSMGLMLIWVCASSYGIKNMPNTWMRGMYYYDAKVTAIGTTIVSLLTGMLVVSSLVWAEIERGRYHHAGPAPRHFGRWVFPMCLIVCVMLFTGLTWIEPDQVSSFRAMRNSTFAQPGIALGVAAICVIALLQAFVLMRMLYPVMRRANLVIGFAVGLLWIAPLVADSIYDANKYPYDAAPMDFLSMGSPLGWMSKADMVSPSGRLCGILFQLEMLMLLVFLRQLINLKRGRKASQTVRDNGSTSGHSGILTSGAVLEQSGKSDRMDK